MDTIYIMKQKSDIYYPWTLGPVTPNLDPGHVYVWRILLPIETEFKSGLQKTLSEDELSRLEKFHFDSDRDRMLVARGALRDILARYLNKAPSTVQFHYTEFGKPFLNQSSLKFNVSHAHHCILIAIANNMDVGIDVEYSKNAFNYLSIAKEFFTLKEYAFLLTLNAEERQCAFYRFWTQKEAILKGVGLGLQVPLNQFDVSKNNEWQLSDISLGEDYIAALATSKNPNKIFLWDWGKI